MTLKKIPYGKQFIEEDDIQAVEKVLASDWLTQGPTIDLFEKEFAKRVNAKFAVACSSGTAGLHLACLAAGFKEGDIVLTVPITFLASANCVRYVGADIDLIDVDLATICIDTDSLLNYIKNNLKNKNIRGIIPVHFSGMPCNMPVISEIAREYDLIVIEDACHALGASYLDGGDVISVGSCRHSLMTVFSFHPVKHITTGEGGMITTNSFDIYKKLCCFRNHGIIRDDNLFLHKDIAFFKLQNGRDLLRANPWYYEMHSLGYNYRITDIQCALGLSQLKKLDLFLERRKEIANTYIKSFENLEEIIVLMSKDGTSSAWHLFPVQFDINKLKINRFQIVEEYHKNGIGVQIHYIPLHFQPYYRALYRFIPGRFKNAEMYYERCLSLPLYSNMQAEDINRVINVTYQIVNRDRHAK